MLVCGDAGGRSQNAGSCWDARQRSAVLGWRFDGYDLNKFLTVLLPTTGRPPPGGKLAMAFKGPRRPVDSKKLNRAVTNKLLESTNWALGGQSNLPG